MISVKFDKSKTIFECSCQSNEYFCLEHDLKFNKINFCISPKGFLPKLRFIYKILFTGKVKSEFLSVSKNEMVELSNFIRDLAVNC